MIMDTERDGWMRVGILGWRKSLRDKHWAQIVKDPLGWAWTIHKADPTTMCPITVAGSVADGLDISLAAAKDDVDHWARSYHRHAVVVEFHTDRRLWLSRCRVCHKKRGLFEFPGDAADDLVLNHPTVHAECEAAWQRGER
jgi:hypothetical protein